MERFADGIAGKCILVTGSNGFVGRRLLLELKKNGAHIYTLYETNGSRIDIRNWDKIRAQFNRQHIDIIYHLAAVPNVPLSFENPREVLDINISGTTNMLELCRIKKAKIVFASSYVYGPPQYLPIDENHPIKPTNPYAMSKVVSEQLCRQFSDSFQIPCTIMRPFNVFGEGQKETFLIPEIVNSLKTGVIKLRDPFPRRDFIYITDVVNAYIMAAARNRRYDVFNIGSGESFSVEEIAKKISEISTMQNIKIKYAKIERQGEIPDTVANIEKAKKELGWEPEISLDKGLHNVLSSFGI